MRSRWPIAANKTYDRNRKEEDAERKAEHS